MLGLALLAFGVVLLWAAFTRRGGAILDALKIDLPNEVKWEPPDIPIDGDGGEGGGDGAASGGGSNGGDSGTHMGIDDNGHIYVIPKNYGDMTPEEQDDANEYAHNIGNFGSGNA